MSLFEHVQDLSLEEVIGDRFGRYSKYIIQDRALPDVRDGLKPVQRRILYAMYKDGNTHEKAFRKSAKAVGNVIANYHPHGDTSVYDAMLRMSQDWKTRYPMVEMHGNNGSIDGDPPAAMRYTEARLSKIAAEMIRDIEKETVEHALNFDDTYEEPVVLPSRIPNLLVSGATGISAGYATNIPPHNLHEVIDALLLKLRKTNVTTEELMEHIQGPDFPTGGILEGRDGLKKAYESGRGRIVMRAKATVEPLKAGKSQIIITEIPYDVNKAQLVRKMDEVRLDKKLDAIAEIRDESDRDGLRIVIEMKKDRDAQAILDYFYKHTDLQTTYNFNMIAISNGRPTLMSLNGMLDAYIEHQKEVIYRRTKYDIEKANARLHIVEGLVYALSHIDDVIQTIRESESKKDAKSNLMIAFDLTEKQAEAIVSLQLYRLTNTDITELETEEASLRQSIEKWEVILHDESALKQVLRNELRDIQKRFPLERFSTPVRDEVREIEVDVNLLVPSEDVVVSVSKDGYVKRTSTRSYAASDKTGYELKPTDYLLLEQTLNTQHFLLLFTSLGNYIYQPIHELPDIRWRDLGQHISSIVKLKDEEEIVDVIPVESFDTDDVIVTYAAGGNVKVSHLKEFEVQRYGRTLKAMNVKRGDVMQGAFRAKPTDDIFLVSKEGYGLRFNLEEITITSIRTAGVKGLDLKKGESLARALRLTEETEQLAVATNRGTIKRMPVDLFERSSRALRGTRLIREVKSNPFHIIGVEDVTLEDELVLVNEEETQTTTQAGDIRLTDLDSSGVGLTDEKEDGTTFAFYKKQEATT